MAVLKKKIWVALLSCFGALKSTVEYSFCIHTPLYIHTLHSGSIIIGHSHESRWMLQCGRLVIRLTFYNSMMSNWERLLCGYSHAQPLQKKIARILDLAGEQWKSAQGWSLSLQTFWQQSSSGILESLALVMSTAKFVGGSYVVYVVPYSVVHPH